MGLIFALGAGLCCLCLGLGAGAALDRRRERLGAWRRALERMDTAMGERLPLGRILCRGDLKELRAMAEDLAAEPLLSLKAAWERRARGQEAAEVLNELFEQLDSGDLAARRQALKQAAAQLEGLEQLAAREAERSRPLLRSLGLWGGLALTLLLV